MLPTGNPSAICAQTDPELFFPAADERAATGKARRAVAKRLCGVCPLRRGCLSWALDSGEDYGIWGGYSENERRRLSRKLRALRNSTRAGNEEMRKAA